MIIIITEHIINVRIVIFSITKAVSVLYKTILNKKTRQSNFVSLITINSCVDICVLSTVLTKNFLTIRVTYTFMHRTV
jgi:nicotinamidase-related amidase